MAELAERQPPDRTAPRFIMDVCVRRRACLITVGLSSVQVHLG